MKSERSIPPPHLYAHQIPRLVQRPGAPSRLRSGRDHSTTGSAKRDEVLIENLDAGVDLGHEDDKSHTAEKKMRTRAPREGSHQFFVTLCQRPGSRVRLLTTQKADTELPKDKEMLRMKTKGGRDGKGDERPARDAWEPATRDRCGTP